jgi:DNA polymerase-3 subunit delta'
VTVRFASFVGNTDVVRRLGVAERRGAGAHAYLLTGPQQIGKRTLALRFGALATCPNPFDGDACGTCTSCMAAARNAHPDIHLVERREDKRTIIVEQAQEVARIAALRPYQSDSKVIVIVDADAFEVPAANLLLKTIEEPAPDTRIVLTSSDGDQLLPTIRSRCREITLRPVRGQVIADALVQRGIPPEHASLVARLSDGRPGWAINASNDPSFLGARTTHLDLLASVLSLRRNLRLPLADHLEDSRNLSRTRETMATAFSTWIAWWRDVLVVRAGCTELVAGIDRIDEMRAAARALNVPSVTSAIKRTGIAVTHLDDNVNPRLAVESLLLDLPDLGAA